MSTTRFTVNPAGPSAPRIAPDADDASAAATFHTSARLALAAARSAGVKLDSWYADHVACVPYMNMARTATATTTLPVSAATSANGVDAATTAATAGTGPIREATMRPCTRAPRLPATAIVPRATPI